MSRVRPLLCPYSSVIDSLGIARALGSPLNLSEELYLELGWAYRQFSLPNSSIFASAWSSVLPTARPWQVLTEQASVVPSLSVGLYHITTTPVLQFLFVGTVFRNPRWNRTCVLFAILSDHLAVQSKIFGS